MAWRLVAIAGVPVLAQADDPAHSTAQHARRAAAARDFQQRVEAAIATVQELQATRKPSAKAPRASTTAAEARVMKMGGFRPALNVPLARAGSPLGGPRTIVRGPGHEARSPDHDRARVAHEGITVASIAVDRSATLKPLLVSSAGRPVAAIHDLDGQRAILDGGFTRLCLKWDTAGTARYVKNAAAWLANAERFGQ